jgi:hypothetical protein
MTVKQLVRFSSLLHFVYQRMCSLSSFAFVAASREANWPPMLLACALSRAPKSRDVAPHLIHPGSHPSTRRCQAVIASCLVLQAVSPPSNTARTTAPGPDSWDPPPESPAPRNPRHPRQQGPTDRSYRCPPKPDSPDPASNRPGSRTRRVGATRQAGQQSLSYPSSGRRPAAKGVHGDDIGEDPGYPATPVGELKQANNVVEPACNLI